jgi:hypothetical protein
MPENPAVCRIFRQLLAFGGSQLGLRGYCCGVKHAVHQGNSLCSILPSDLEVDWRKLVIFIVSKTGKR